jgi:regulator of sigma E protease
LDALVILYVVVGVSLVIFVHELGHFAVAKWAGVKVERFSIGFPMPKAGVPAIPVGVFGGIAICYRFVSGAELNHYLAWGVGGAVAGLAALILGRIGSLKLFTDRDGTEYLLGFLPVGGYVKMLGENPEEQAEQTGPDPRSYAAQPVYKRMMIISAGVVMNIIFAFIWFVVAYNVGVSYQPTVIHKVIPGSPAWKAGLEPGDEIVEINQRRDPTFEDLMRSVALSDPAEGGIDLKGTKADGKPFALTLVPEPGEIVPVIGVSPEIDTRLADEHPVVKGMSAAAATPPFAGGDRVVAVNGEAVNRFVDLESALDRARGDTVTVRVARSDQQSADGDITEVDIAVGPNYFRTLGLRNAMGAITAIKDHSPAAGRLTVGDVITHVNGREIGSDLDPFRLPDVVFTLAGRETRLTVRRPGEEGPVEVEVTPEPRAGWIERPISTGDPLTVPALGIAYEVLPVVVAVDPDSPAAKAGIRPEDRIVAVRFVSDDPSDPSLTQSLPLTGDDEKNWPAVFWFLQQEPSANVELTVSEGSGEKVVQVAPQADLTWPLPMRGISFKPLLRTRKTTSLVAAAKLGVHETWGSLTQVYLVLRRMLSGQISPKALGGPISIAAAAGQSAKRGIPDLLVFLALFSANLAVLNFLPIPILDGGHMVFLVWEAIRGKPADERAMIIANYVGLAMILCLMLYVFVLDVNRWFIQ